MAEKMSAIPSDDLSRHPVNQKPTFMAPPPSYDWRQYPSTLVQEQIDLYDYVDEKRGMCERYVAARAFSFPTDEERRAVCRELGDGWIIAPDQRGVRVSFVRCIHPERLKKALEEEEEARSFS